MDDMLSRVSQNLMDRIGGPLSFRFLLQPAMSMFFAIRDGIHDAKTGEPAYFWSFFSDPAHRTERMKAGWKSVGRVFIFGCVMDIIYQIIALHKFYPGEMLITAFILAVVPYILLRGPINRIMKYRHPSSTVR